jgi:hypothetical protein
MTAFIALLVIAVLVLLPLARTGWAAIASHRGVYGLGVERG